MLPTSQLPIEPLLLLDYFLTGRSNTATLKQGRRIFKMKKPVTARALVKRLNRHLPKDGLKVFQCKINAHGHHELGSYYIVDTKMNMINAMHVDVEQLARHEGVLKEYEEIVK